ncbi:hypothetical protein [Azospirillum baldaniorum]|uniref:hypothetical protein n=1 Tax=Azospirillum baldaniorum TaxID=1064539 RepID=UPI0011A4357F|nr:hypothetical protein [Azospirillum baldaniorum]
MKRNLWLTLSIFLILLLNGFTTVYLHDMQGEYYKQISAEINIINQIISNLCENIENGEEVCLATSTASDTSDYIITEVLPLIPPIGALITAIGTISALVISWRLDRRQARDFLLRERELNLKEREAVLKEREAELRIFEIEKRLADIPKEKGDSPSEK